jgi:cell division protein FtsB
MAEQRGRTRDARARPAGGRGPSGSAGSRSAGRRATTGQARPTAARAHEPRLTRVRSRAGEVMARTTGLLGLSSTKRAAILAIVVCALALTVAVPLHNYVAQRQQLSEVTEREQALQGEVDDLSAQRDRLSDPAEVAAQARSRLGYVAPGETPYVVQLPAPATAPQTGVAEPGVPWFHTLWTDVSGAQR